MRKRESSSPSSPPAELLERRICLSAVPVPGLPDGSIVPLWQDGAVEYFVIAKSAQQSLYDNTIWRSDGTSAGTFRLGTPDSQTYFVDGNFVRGHASNGKHLFLILDDDSSGSVPQLWNITIATGSARYVRDFQNVGESSADTLNGVFYFAAQDTSKHGEELWRSDGTADGTYMLNDLIKGAGSSNPGEFAVLGKQLFFNANLDQSSDPLMATDGTSAGTHLVVRLPTNSINGFTGPFDLQPLGSKLLFKIRPENPLLGDEQIYSTDGTAKGTSLLLTNTSSTTYFGTVGNYAIYTNGDGVWTTNGTGSGTYKLRTGSWSLDYIINGRAYFSQPASSSTSSTSSSGDTMPTKFSTDGTPKGTADGPAPFDTGFTGIDNARAVRDGILIQGSLRNQNSQFYFTDGTLAGSYPVTLDSGAYFMDYHPAWAAPVPRLFYSTNINGYDSLGLGVYVPHTGNIAGYVFDDVNGDGVRQSGEPPLNGYKVFLDRNGDGICNKNEPWTRATRTGRYTLGCIGAGKASVRIVGVPGWHAMTPEMYRVTVTVEKTVTRNFGRAPDAMIAGTVYWDKNLDKHRESKTEPGLEDETVFIDFDGDNHIDKNDIVAYTDAAGKYSLVPPAPGTYTVHLLKKSGTPTTPKNGTGLFTVAANGITIADFGVAVG